MKQNLSSDMEEVAEDYTSEKETKWAMRLPHFLPGCNFYHCIGKGKQNRIWSSHWLDEAETGIWVVWSI